MSEQITESPPPNADSLLIQRRDEPLGNGAMWRSGQPWCGEDPMPSCLRASSISDM